jgi:N-acetylmuramoyl-L-alanine amidase
MKLALDAGHSMNTAGKRCLRSLDPNETREWWLNNRLCNYLQQNMAKYDIQILRLDDTSGVVDIPLIERTNKANSWGADFTISVHHNAGANGTAAGGITIHAYTYAKEPVLTYQKSLYDTLIRITGLKGNRASPLVKNNLHMTREIKDYRSLLVEHGYMDSSTDVPIILSDAFSRNAAKAHEEWLVKTFNLKLKGDNSMQAGTKVKIKQTATTYMTGQTIPATSKGKEYTIRQLGHPWNVVGDGALIDEIVSWVWLKDLELAAPVQPVVPATVLKSEYDKVVSELNAAKTQNTTLQTQNTSLQTQNANFQAQIKTLQTQLKSEQDKVTSLTIEKDQYKQTSVQYQVETFNVKKTLEEQKAEVSRLNRVLAETNDKYISLLIKETEYQERIKELSDLKEELDLTIEVLSSYSEKTEIENGELKEKLQEQSSQVQSLQDEVVHLNYHREKLEDLVNKYTEDFSELPYSVVVRLLFSPILKIIEKMFSNK